VDACGYVRDAGGSGVARYSSLSRFYLADRSSRLLVLSWAFFRSLIAAPLACTFVVVRGYRLWVATTPRPSRCQRFRVGGSESITKLRTISQCVVLKIKWKENRNTLPVNYLAPSLPYTPDTEHLAILPGSGAVRTCSDKGSLIDIFNRKSVTSRHCVHSVRSFLLGSSDIVVSARRHSRRKHPHSCVTGPLSLRNRRRL